MRVANSLACARWVGSRVVQSESGIAVAGESRGRVDAAVAVLVEVDPAAFVDVCGRRNVICRSESQKVTANVCSKIRVKQGILDNGGLFTCARRSVEGVERKARVAEARVALPRVLAHVTAIAVL